MINLSLQQINIALTSSLVVVGLLNNFTPVQAQPTRLTNQRESYALFVPPPPSTEGKPRGRRSGGASRDGCPAVDRQLTALVPENNLGLTIAKSPTFWFFVPQLPTTARSGEFVLQDEAHNDLYRTPFKLPEKPGIVSIRLPSNPQSSLKIDKMYRWHFRIYCQPQTTSEYYWVEGWVKQVALNPTLESQLEAAKPQEYIIYAENGLWYEALTRLAELRLKDPQNTTLNENWTKLLKSVGLEEFAKAPLFGSVLPPG